MYERELFKKMKKKIREKKRGNDFSGRRNL